MFVVVFVLVSLFVVDCCPAAAGLAGAAADVPAAAAAAVELAAADGPTGSEGVGRLTWEVATAHFGRKATLMVALILAATVTMPTSPPVPCGSLPFYPFQG